MHFQSLEFELPFFSFIFIFMLWIVYTFKKKVPLVENKPYEVILYCSLFSSFLDTIVHIISAFSTLNELNTTYFRLIDFLNKIMSTLFVIIFSCLLLYTLIISYPKVKENFKKYALSFIIVDSLFFITTLFTHIEIIEIGGVRNVNGLTIYFGYTFVALFLLASIITTIINFKKDKRYYAVYSILLTMILLYACSLVFKGLIIYDVILALLCYIMYFTIENPDIKMIKKLEFLRDEAEKANRAKTDFLASMSHEIRTPLNAIIGFSNDIIEHKEDASEEIIDDSKNIVMASNTLLEIVGNILDINKIEANKLEVEEVSYKLRDEIYSLCEINKIRIGQKNVVFNVKIDDNVPDNLIGDKLKLKTIVNNLVTNAIKYTEHGKIDLQIGLIGKLDGDVVNLKIVCEDTGIGIKEENISKLFTKFERLDVEKNSTIEGTGLGLVITKALVEILGGTIKVESFYGMGSKFIVNIPQKINRSTIISENSSLNKELQKESINDTLYTDKKVLIVDDNKLNIKVARRVLESIGLNSDECYNGAECLEKIKQGNKYDVILMDIMMPVMNGEQALLELKKLPNFVMPVIALTADAVSGAEEKYRSEGFDEYISKPFTKEQLQLKLSKVLQNGQLDFTFLSKNGINFEKSDLYLKNSSQYLQNLMRWHKNSKDEFKMLKQSCEEFNLVHYRNAIERLINECSELGFGNLKIIAEEHELQCGDEKNSDYIVKYFSELEKEYKKIALTLDKFFNNKDGVK